MRFFAYLSPKVLATVAFSSMAVVAMARQQATPTVDTNSPAPVIINPSTGNSFLGDLRDQKLGPFALHPRLTAGFTYDDNILLSTTGKEADEIWTVQPGLQAVAGDDAALAAHRIEYNDVLGLTPGNLIVEPADTRPSKFLLLDYAPRFQIFDKYTGNNSLDQFATLNFLWPVHKLILGVKQDYQDQKTTIIEASQRTTVESLTTTLSAAYQFTDKSSVESDFHRIETSYGAPNLIGYTEYNTEDWYNYAFEENLPLSLGVLAGEDEVVNHQNQTYEQIRLRARYFRTEKLTFDASVGAELREYQNGSSSTLNPVFNLIGEYHATARTTVRLSAYRQLFASIFDGNNYTSTGASIDYGQGITSRYTAGVSLGYFNLAYAPTTDPSKTHSDDYYTARIGLTAKFGRHLQAQIFAQWLNRSSPADGSLTDDQIGCQVSVQY